MPPLDMAWQMWPTFALIVTALVSYAIERIPMELTSTGLIAALLLLFHFAPIEGALDSRQLLAGFADPALIAVISLLVVGQGLVRTGALDGAIRRLSVLRRQHPVMAAAAVLTIVAVLSAVMNNTPVVVIFIPIMAALAQRVQRSVSGLLMPLSFAAILGGMTTLIGSSTNLLVSGALTGLGYAPIGFFDFVVPGAVIAAVGLVYVLLIAPRLLPDRASMAREIVGGDGKQYIAQIAVRPDSGLVGQKTVAGMIPNLPDITVRLIQRGEHAFLPLFDEVTLAPGDILIIAATRQALTEALAKTADLLPEGDRVGGVDQVLVEVVVAPASRMIGRNLQQIGFRYQTDCIVLGVQRRSRMIRASMDEIRLEAGDVLLVVGTRPAVQALRANRDVLLLEWSAHDVPAAALARRALLIFAGVIAVAALDIVPIAIAALAGAAAMIATGCLNIHQASRAADRRVILLIAAALAMGAALQETGGAAFLAHVIVSVFADFGPAVTLSAMFMLIALLTNVMSNNATAVLFTPIAVGTAIELGVAPLPFVYAVVFAANCSFATPMGYQTNLLVMAPGHYRFSDFLRAGGPLIFIVWLTFTCFAPWYYAL